MKKILVIEDEPVLLNNILRILNADKFDAKGALDGEIGVNLAQSEQPDLIICDIMMPELDGYGVLSQLQQKPETALIPFIFLTAKAEKADRRQGIEMGADDYLTKPFEVEELLRAIAARFNKQDLLKKRLILLSEELTKLQNLLKAKERLLESFDREVRHPLSNINMAIKMLETEPSSKILRDRYLKILEDEFAREISLINQMSHLQHLLTPENVNLLAQFNLLSESKQPQNK